MEIRFSPSIAFEIGMWKYNHIDLSFGLNDYELAIFAGVSDKGEYNFGIVFTTPSHNDHFITWQDGLQ